MKILFISRGFPSEQDPMAGNYEAVQAKALAQKGHEVSVLAIQWRSLVHKLSDTPLNCRIVDCITVFECKKSSFLLPSHLLARFEIKNRQRLFGKIFKKYLKKNGMPDVVHAHIISCASPAIILKEKYRLPFVITEHWSKMNVDNISPWLALQAKVYRKADRVICVSDALANNLKKHFDIDCAIIHNMVPDAFFVSRKIDRNDYSFRFITIGALRKLKRFDLLIEAFAKSGFQDNVVLDIVGGGEEKTALENKIVECGLSKQVHLLGVKSHEEVCDLLCQSDCFVLSSSSETFGIVIIEALAKGLPVVSTASGGPQTFMRKEDGLLIPIEDVAALTNALKYMVEHHKEYDPEEIRQHCYQAFSQDVIADEIIDLYKQVLGSSQNN